MMILWLVLFLILIGKPKMARLYLTTFMMEKYMMPVWKKRGGMWPYMTTQPGSLLRKLFLPKAK